MVGDQSWPSANNVLIVSRRKITSTCSPQSWQRLHHKREILGYQTQNGNVHRLKLLFVPGAYNQTNR